MRRRVLLLAGLTALSLSGCATPVAVEYLTLTPASQGTVRHGAAAISVAPPVVPDYLKRNGLARRDTAGALRYSAAELWAEPLDHGIQRLLVNTLADALGDTPVLPFPAITSTATHYRLSVVIRRLEATDSTVALDASWRIDGTAESAGTPAVTGRFSDELPLASVAGPAIARGYSTLIQSLAGIIAERIPAAAD